ncbi:hypothetical protein LPTSP4_32970 [Leptospira ryugenii]|uniref:Uncharacterized protein n=1 Tax=Leptospira ryugenii TaxID=1917863 RepID=A0A2P2E4E8_9LEPT|nr:hypothetical protein [Leptospira ryugenii]GBF51759.1 hypothetical protein LPTSP4_32970 [Leptospira ryugenii]
MSDKLSCGDNCSWESIQTSFWENKEIPSDVLLGCETCFQRWVEMEEALTSLVSGAGLRLANVDPSFCESLDLAKAETAMKTSLELPDFLKEYSNANLGLPERKDSILVRLTDQGIRLVGSLLETIRVQETFSPMPSVRAGQDSLLADPNSVIFEEKVSENQTFYYQLVREDSDDIYLSVKAETPLPGFFHQVNLRKDGRFILSSKINSDGTASFNGLKAGNYKIEFQGDRSSKSFDLSILVG